MAFALSVDGGMANAYHQRIGLPGVRQGDDGPFPRSLEHAVMQGKARGGPRFTSFGVRDGLVWLCHTRKKYCHNGGMAIAHHHGGDSGEEGAD